MKTALIILMGIILPLSLIAQDVQFQQEQYPFPLTFNGFSPHLGFTAAASYYHHDFGDLDGDGDFEIIIGAGFQREYLFENIGTVQTAEYTMVSTQIVVPTSSETLQAPSFCDIDDDRDLDLFVTDAFGWIAFYENIGDSINYNFILNDSTFEDIHTANGTVLDFVDIDNDEDYDLFIGNYFGYPQAGRMYFYRNDGTPEEPDMVYVTNYFEGIDVGANASPEFCDIDDDGDYDLFVGSEYGSICFYENIGSPLEYDFEYVTNYYYEIDVGTDAAPRFCDIDADGDFDLFVANESYGSTNDFLEGDIAFYENVGNASEAQFQFVTGQFLFMDISKNSAPSLVDIDNDGILELLVGVKNGEIIYFENSGTETEPNFYLYDSAFCDLDVPYKPVLSFGDLDNDDDLDIVVRRGGANEYIMIYQNIGNITEPDYEMWTTVTQSSGWGFSGVDLVDIDNDEDLDLFIGNPFNDLQYWENAGSVNMPNFQMVSNAYLGENFELAGKYFRFRDLDHDADYDLLIGHAFPGGYTLYLIYWENIGTPSNANFIPQDTIAVYEPYTVVNPVPEVVDVDGDGDDDIVVGELGGSFLFYRNLEFGGGSDIELIMTPHNTPIQIQPGGGFFTFDVEVENVSITNYLIDFITDATLPNGNHYPILLRSNIPLNAGVLIIRENMTQAVPGNAPSGDYSYNAYVRNTTTQDTLASDSFDFVKLESMDAVNPWVFEWGLNGWDEEVSLNHNNLPEFFGLSAYPNPFNAETTIKLQVPDNSNISIKVFNTTGQEVAVLKDGHVNAGYHQIKWNAEGFSSGVYLIRLDTQAGFSESRKVMLVK